MSRFRGGFLALVKAVRELRGEGRERAFMAAPTEREGLRGQVPCVYFEPPDGINFNFQRFTTLEDIRAPDQIRAFCDT